MGSNLAPNAPYRTWESLPGLFLTWAMNHIIDVIVKMLDKDEKDN